MLMLNVIMNPDNNNQQADNQNLQKLEQDLEKLTKEAASTVQSEMQNQTEVSSVQPQVQPEIPTQPVQTQEESIGKTQIQQEIQTQPTQPATIPQTPPNLPVESNANQKSFSLITVAILLLVAAIIIVVGYVVFTKFTTLQTEREVSTPTPVATPTLEPTPQASDSAILDLTSWRQIINKYWSFKMPANLRYILCSPEGNHVMIDSSITSDQEAECNFDTINLISISRLTSVYPIPTNPSVIPTTDPNSSVGNASKMYTLVSDKKNILIDGKTAIYQKEVQYGGQGEGTYIRVYVVDGPVTYTFSLKDISQKDIFDQILSTFKFISATPSATPQ